MTRMLTAAAALVFFLGAAQALTPVEDQPAKGSGPPAGEAPPPPPPAPPPPSKRRGPRAVQGGMAMKPVVCKSVDDGKGKAGQDLAQAIETLATQFSHANYRLSAILPGDPPIACFYSLSDSSKLPMGAR